MTTTTTTTTTAMDQFLLHGWQSDPSLSDDENYMDLVFLITRSRHPQTGQQGHMGALMVRPSTQENEECQASHQQRIVSHVLGAATNQPLFGTKEVTSDIHAEISALGQACQAGQSTTGCTAYITIPPCKRCFAALVAFGIDRIVTRQEAPAVIRTTALAHDMLVEHFSREQNRRQMERINQLVNPSRSDAELMKHAERTKQWRKAHKVQHQQQNQEKDQTST